MADKGALALTEKTASIADARSVNPPPRKLMGFFHKNEKRAQEKGDDVHVNAQSTEESVQSVAFTELFR